MDLNEIGAPVHDAVRRFDAHFKEQMKSNVFLLDTVIRYLVRKPGKRVRPMLVFLAAEACGGVNPRSFTGASMVELLHTATLVHDDVVDQAQERRGMAAINAIWKNKVAVLLGDYLLSRGLLVAVDHDEFDFLRVTSTAVRRMSEGELLQIQKTRQLNADEETYLKIIGDKTASLLSSCCEIGAISGTQAPEWRKALRDYGEYCGLAFQIRDDIFDYTSDGRLIGKPVGNDIRERKLTMPIIYALAKAEAKEAKAVLKIIKSKPGKAEVARVVEFVRNNGGIEYAARRSEEYVAAAVNALSVLPDTAARRSLEAFARFTTQRTS